MPLAELCQYNTVYSVHFSYSQNKLVVQFAKRQKAAIRLFARQLRATLQIDADYNYIHKSYTD